MTQVGLNQRAAVQPWTPAEEEILRQMVADNATRFEIAQRLNRSIESVAGKVQYLGLCKRNATVDLPGEIWKVISRNANYEVSNLGRIRNKHTLREMKLSKDGSGYPQLTLPNGDGTRRRHPMADRKMSSTITSPKSKNVPLNLPEKDTVSTICAAGDY
jgi:hypothetical protein